MTNQANSCYSIINYAIQGGVTMSVVAGLSTNVLKYVDNLHLETIKELLQNVEPTLTRKFLEELTLTINSMTTMFLLEGAHQNYNAKQSLETALAFIKYLQESTPELEEYLEEYNKTISKSEPKVSLTLLEIKVEKLLNYINQYVMMSVAGETMEDKTLNILKNFEQNSSYEKSYAKYYNTGLSNVFSFKSKVGKSLKYPTRSDGTTKHCCVLPDKLDELLEEKDNFSRYVALVASLIEYTSKDDALALVYQFMNISTLTIVKIAELFGTDTENARKIIEGKYVDDLRLHMRLNEVPEEQIDTLTASSKLADIKKDMEKARFPMNPYKSILEINAINELQNHMVNLLLIDSIHIFSTVNSELKELLDVPESQLRKPESLQTGYNLDRFIAFGKDLVSDDTTRRPIQKWWRFYAHYNTLLINRTTLFGLTPNYHGAFNYYHPQNSATYFDDTKKFTELLKFTITMVNDAFSHGVKPPNQTDCSVVIDTMFKELAKGQYTTAQRVNYERSIIRPAVTIIEDLKSIHEDVTATLGIISTRLSTSGLVDEAVSSSIKSVYDNMEVINFLLTTTDWTLIPPSISDWYSVNTYIPNDMEIMLREYAQLIAIYNEIHVLYEELKYRHEVFDNKKLGLQSSEMSIYRIAKDEELRSIRGTISFKNQDGSVTTDLQKTFQAVTSFKNDVANKVIILRDRLDFIAEYENAYNSDNKEFKDIRKNYSEFVEIVVGYNTQTSSLINDAIQLHYGHMELNNSFSAYKARENRLEPVKIEQSKTKPIIESTHKRHQDWYKKIEAREFMLGCLSSPEYITKPVW